MTAENDAVHLMAADWLARLREPEVSLEETLAWQRWMASDTRHAQAFARMEEVSTALRSIPRPARPNCRTSHLDQYDASMSIGRWLQLEGSRRQSHHRSRNKVSLGAISASILVATIALTWTAFSDRFSSWSTATTKVQTAVGKHRKIQLADGSEIILGGDTRLIASFSDKLRRVDLSRGEAFFKVAKDRSRPFRVHAGEAAVLAVGTAFNVQREADRVVVAVIEGRVIVEPETRILPVALLREFKPQFASVNLEAGHQTTAGTAGVQTATPLADPAAATAWQTGRLAFRLEPLRYVLEDVNRYSPKPIVIDDERIASLRVTGTVMGDNVIGWVGSLQSALGIEAVEEPDRIILRSRR